MASPCHEFRRAFAYALGPLASCEGAVIQEEAQQIQIALAQFAAEEEVVAEAPVEVLDHGTAPMGLVHRVGDGLKDAVEFPRQQPVQLVAALPVSLRGRSTDTVFDRFMQERILGRRACRIAEWRRRCG